MVLLPEVESSNIQISTSLPRDLVAVFVGATNGIGETTLRQFARFTNGLRPKVIFVGRAQDAGDRIAKECKALSPDGEFTFMKADVGLIKGVDEVCGRIQKSVGTINLLFMSQGTLQTGVGECVFWLLQTSAGADGDVQTPKKAYISLAQSLDMAAHDSWSISYLSCRKPPVCAESSAASSGAKKDQSI